jgi:hypothetical protein
LKTADNVIEIGSPPILKDGVTFVPIRLISEQWGAHVDYNPKLKTIKISPK